MSKVVEYVEERNLSKKGICQRKGFSQRAVRFDDEDIVDVSVQAARRDLVGSSVVDAVVSSTTLVADVGTFLGEAAETLPSGSRVVTARDLAASCTKGEYLPPWHGIGYEPGYNGMEIERK